MAVSVYGIVCLWMTIYIYMEKNIEKQSNQKCRTYWEVVNVSVLMNFHQDFWMVIPSVEIATMGV